MRPISALGVYADFAGEPGSIISTVMARAWSKLSTGLRLGVSGPTIAQTMRMLAMNFVSLKKQLRPPEGDRRACCKECSEWL